MVKRLPLDRTFDALSHGTRRDMLERLSDGPAALSELAEPHGISLPAALKHVRILEDAGLIRTAKVGRKRECRLAREDRLDAAAEWIDERRAIWERRLDRLERLIGRRRAGER